MTFVLIATEDGPTAELGYAEGQTVLERLLAQLAALKVPDVQVITRPRDADLLRKNGHEVIESIGLAEDLWELAGIARTTEELVLLQADLVISDELLARLTRDRTATAITARQPFTGTRPAVRISKRRVVSAGSSFHQVTDPDAVFRGALKITNTAEFADRITELAGLLGTLRPVTPVRELGLVAEELEVFVDNDARDEADRRIEVDGVLGGTGAVGDDAVALALVALVRSGARVTARNVDVLVCERVLTAGEAAAARAAVEAVDEDRVRLDAAVKSNDGFFTTYFVSSYSKHIARWAARRGLTPNMVTCISMAIAVVAAVWFAAGTRLGLVTGGILLYFSFVFDCVDGQVARYTRSFSTLGAWLDATFDRAKEYLAYAGLAVGYGATHSGDVWGAAVATIILQTCRHMVDFSFAVHRGTVLPAPITTVPLDAPDDSLLDPKARPPRKGAGMMAVRLSAALERIPGARWAKKIVILPIGERFALIALTAAFFDAKVTFYALLVWGGLAAAYTLTGRILRSIA